ncbi:MAG TPA: peptidyl-prolyl cis-trans isomerase [Synechococcales cyanobacterium M55_K2018_004]|nr:peptidyl-prolyl cis-trans isomerase [Synechococcales cyanobacterium M55_K2018_004]
MSTEAFITIDGEPISPQKMLRYLQAGRKLEGFLAELVRQFVLERELQHTDLQINSAAIEQAVIDFRLREQLTDPQVFQAWLGKNGMNYESFHQQVAQGFKLQKLKETLADGKLQAYFEERKPALDRVILSRIIVADQELADELSTQLKEGASFEQLAREYSLTDDRKMNGMVGAVSLASLPEMLREAFSQAKPGDVVGPLGMEGRWGLFRFEEFLAASLDQPQLRQSLQDELFERWLSEKMQTLPIQIQTGES